MNFDQSTQHQDTLVELGKLVGVTVGRTIGFPDTDYHQNLWVKRRMAEIRRFYGVPKTVLAQAIGTSYRQYIRFEGGNSKVSVAVLGSLALFYNISLDFLSGLSNEPRALYNGKPVNVNGVELTRTWGTATD